MPSVSMVCPECRARLEISSQKPICYCPCCGKIILQSNLFNNVYDAEINNPVPSDAKQKMTKIKVKDVSRETVSTTTWLDILAMIIKFIYFMFGFVMPFFYLVIGFYYFLMIVLRNSRKTYRKKSF